MIYHYRPSATPAPWQPTASLTLTELPGFGPVSREFLLHPTQNLKHFELNGPAGPFFVAHLGHRVVTLGRDDAVAKNPSSTHTAGREYAAHELRFFFVPALLGLLGRLTLVPGNPLLAKPRRGHRVRFELVALDFARLG